MGRWPGTAEGPCGPKEAMRAGHVNRPGRATGTGARTRNRAIPTHAAKARMRGAAAPGGGPSAAGQGTSAAGGSAWIPGPARRSSQRPRKDSHGGRGASGRSRMRGTEGRGRRRPRRNPSHHAAKRRGRPARAESSQANPKAATDRGRAAMARRTSCTLSCLERHGGRVLPRIESRLRGEWAPRGVADAWGAGPSARRHHPERALFLGPLAALRRFFPFTGHLPGQAMLRAIAGRKPSWRRCSCA